MTPVEAATYLAMVLLATAFLLAVIRLVTGPSLLDRLVAFDLATMAIVGLIGVDSILTGESVILDVAAVLALVAFLATAAFAAYVARTGGAP